MRIGLVVLLVVGVGVLLWWQDRGPESPHSSTAPEDKAQGEPAQLQGVAPKEEQAPKNAPTTEDAVNADALTGRVVAKAGGTPVGGVPVFATQLREGFVSDAAIPSAHAVSDEDGYFSMPDLPRGDWMVFALGHGWASVGLAELKSDAWNPLVRNFPSKDTASLTLLVEKTAQLHVTVQNDGGDPAADIDLTAYEYTFWNRGVHDLDAFKNTHVARTDEAGVARLTDILPNQPTTVSLPRDNLPSESAGPFSLASGAIRTVTIQMRATRWVDVLVTDKKSGEPIPDASLSLTFDPKTGPSKSYMPHFLTTLSPSMKTDDAGRARVSVAHGVPFSIDASAKGYELASGVGRRLEWVKDDTDFVAVRLSRTLAVAGRVVAPDEVPLQDVQITVHTSDYGTFSFVSKDGAFRYEGLLPGSYRMDAEMVHDGTTYLASRTLKAGSEDNELLLLASGTDSAKRPKRMVVHVVDPDGNPVTSCTARLTAIGQHGITSGSPAHGSDAGIIHLEVFDGDLWLDVYDVEERTLGSTQVGPLDPRTITRVQLEPAQSIVGHVRGPGGETVQGASVTAQSLYPRSKTGMQEHAKTFCAKDGRFALHGLSKMDYLISCTPPPAYLQPTPTRVPGGSSDVDIRLERASEIVLTLVDHNDKPVAGANVSVQYSDFKEPSAFERIGLDGVTSDEEGIVRMLGLDSRRRVFFDVTPPSNRTDLRAIHRKDWQLASGTIRLGAGRVLRGIVVDQNDKPIAGATVRWRLAGKRFDHHRSEGKHDGTFELAGVPHKPIDVIAKFDGFLPSGTRAEAALRVAPEENEVRIVLDRGASATIRIQPWTLRSTWSRAQLVATPASGDWDIPAATGTVRSNGEVTFHGLAVGQRYAVWFRGLPEDHYVHATDIVASDKVQVVKPRPGYDIRGTIVPPKDVPLQIKQVQLRDPYGFIVFAKKDEYDLFAKGLPNGPWRVFVWAEDSDGTKYFGTDEASHDDPAVVEMRKR